MKLFKLIDKPNNLFRRWRMKQSNLIVFVESSDSPNPVGFENPMGTMHI